MSKRLSLQGASDDDAAELRELLAGGIAGLQSTWKYYTGADTDLLIIDIDTVYGHMDWLRAHSTGKPVAVLTEHTQFADADLILHKPLTSENLAEVLNRIDSLVADRPQSDDITDTPTPLRVTPVVTAAAPAFSPPAPVPLPVPPRERRLSDWLADGALAAAVRLSDGISPDLVLDPGAKVFLADGNLRALTPHCTREITRAEWQEVSPEELALLEGAIKAQPYARLLWLCHALGSNGQIAAGLDVNAKYKLARWPQIEREFPKHFRIATVMLKQPATLTEIAEQSGATLADVIDFTNAYNATGYIESDGGASEPVQRDSGRGAILSRLRNPFGGG
jgi:hypothetical protein